VGVGASYPGVCDAAGNTAQEACLVAQALRQMLAGSLSWYEVEYPCHSPDAERWFKMQATVHRGDGAARVVVQHHDITRRVLLERDERLRSRLLDEVDAAVIATDLDGRVTLWSRGAQALYAWTDEEAVGEPLADLTVPSQFHDRMDRFAEHARENTRWEGDLKLRRKDGSTFTGFVRASVACDEGARPSV